MGEHAGGLEVALDAITVGVRHRKDVGDLEPLMASIAKYGLLQPITVTPELVLVCGWRRREAMLRLGWTHTRPWWRPGLSEDATTVLAEHDENFLRQAYSKSEQATLFRELKTVLQQEAARRQSAHWFTSTSHDGGPTSQGAQTGDDRQDLDEPDEYGSGSAPGPEEMGKPGDAREQAAQLVAGRKSYHALERIGTLMDLAVDPEQPEDVRSLAAEAVARIDEGHPLKPEWERVQAALAAHAPVTDDVPGGRSPAAPDRSRSAPARSSGAPAVSRAALRAWVMTWRGASALLAEHDPAVLGPVLPEADWHAVRDLSQNLTDFLRMAQTAREEAGLPTMPDHTDGRAENEPDGQADEQDTGTALEGLTADIAPAGAVPPAAEPDLGGPGPGLASVISIGVRS